MKGAKIEGEDVKGCKNYNIVGLDTRITTYSFTSNSSKPNKRPIFISNILVNTKQGSANSLLAQRLKMRKKDSLKSG